MIRSLKNKIDGFRADPHMQYVARGTILAFVIKVIGAGLAFSLNVAVARLLGAQGAGLFFLALSVTTMGSVIGRIGLDNALLRFVATYATFNEWGKVRGVYALGVRMAIAASGAVTLVVFLMAPWLAIQLFHKPELIEPLRWMSLSILPFTLLNLQAESLKGLKRIKDAMLIQGVGLPLASLLLLYPMAQHAGVTGAAWAYATGAIIIAGFGGWVWHKDVAGKGSTVKVSFKELWFSCGPLFMISIVNRGILSWGPLFLLGVWSTSVEVGIFGSALRIAMLVSFLLVAVNNVIAPKFAELYANGYIRELESTAIKSAVLVIIMASPLFIILIVGKDWVLGLFGEEFIGGGTVLMILSLAQLINAVTGSVGFVLTMSGKEKEAWLSVLYSACLLILTGVVLIPYLGMTGAAVAMLLSELCKNSMLIYYCKKVLGVNPVPFVNV